MALLGFYDFSQCPVVKRSVDYDQCPKYVHVLLVQILFFEIIELVFLAIFVSLVDVSLFSFSPGIFFLMNGAPNIFILCDVDYLC